MECLSLKSKIWTHLLVSVLDADMWFSEDFLGWSPCGKTMGRYSDWNRRNQTCCYSGIQFWGFTFMKIMNQLQKQQHTSSHSYLISDKYLRNDQETGFYWIPTRKRLHGYGVQEVEFLYLRDTRILRHVSFLYSTASSPKRI